MLRSHRDFDAVWVVLHSISAITFERLQLIININITTVITDEKLTKNTGNSNKLNGETKNKLKEQRNLHSVWNKRLLAPKNEDDYERQIEHVGS